MGRADAHRDEFEVCTILALPRTISTVTEVRSTTVCASLLGLAKAGLSHRYFAKLPSHLHPEIAAMTAGGWIPVDLAMAHYQACEELDLDAAQFETLFAEAGTRLRGTILSTLIAASRAFGATPLAPMRCYDRTWERLFRGGAVGVNRLGPKAAQVEARGLPLLQIPYYARGFQRLHQRAYELFGASVRITHGRAADANSVVYKVTWA